MKNPSVMNKKKKINFMKNENYEVIMASKNEIHKK